MLLCEKFIEPDASDIVCAVICVDRATSEIHVKLRAANSPKNDRITDTYGHWDRNYLVPKGGYDYKEIEWVEFSDQVPKVESLIRTIFQFEYGVNDGKLKFYGYK